MKDINIIKITPEQLTCSQIFRLNHKYHTDIYDFTIIFDNKTFTLYVNKSVSDEDIIGFTKIILYQGKYINEPDSEVADILDYIYEKYGHKTWIVLQDAYKTVLDEKLHALAKKAAVKHAEIITKYRMENDIASPNEHLIYHVKCIGEEMSGYSAYDLAGMGTQYVFYLGYLIGKGIIRIEESEETS